MTHRRCIKVVHIASLSCRGHFERLLKAIPSGLQSPTKKRVAGPNRGDNWGPVRHSFTFHLVFRSPYPWMSGRGLDYATSFMGKDKYGLVAASLLVFSVQEILLSSLENHH